MDNAQLVDRYFAAMRRGQSAEADLLALFDDDAVYIEPFSADVPAIGIDAIRERLRMGWETPLPEMELDVLTVEVDEAGARSTWECRSPALPGPMRGEDRYHIRGGRITRLEVRMIDGA